jgi:hypothetical protein
MNTNVSSFSYARETRGGVKFSHLFVLLILAIMFSGTAKAEGCIEMPTPDCQESWMSAMFPITVILPTSPPCTVTTTVFVRKKCKYIILDDIDYSFYINPTHCYNTLDPNTRNQMLWKAIREKLAVTIASQNPTLYPCPDEFAQFEIRNEACWRLVTIYYLQNPIGGGGSGPYQLPWGGESLEQHMQTLQSLGANMNTLAAHLMPCSDKHCCVREVKVCFLNGVPIVTSMPDNYTPMEECPTGEDLSCRFNMCDGGGS